LHSFKEQEHCENEQAKEDHIFLNKRRMNKLVEYIFSNCNGSRGHNETLPGKDINKTLG
jgi:hypothetical protein